MIVCGKTVSRLGIAEQVAEACQEGGLEIEIFDEVEPEPSIETMIKGAKRPFCMNPTGS